MSTSGTFTVIAQAEGLIQYTAGAVAHQSLRAACWMLRTAFESAVRELLTNRGIAVGAASARTVHLCLQALYLETAPDLVRDVESAWDRLSRAVHHHAYELSPVYSEVRDLADTVSRIVEFAQHPVDPPTRTHHSEQDHHDVALEVH
ncbi:hypothetical protein [Myceligenerans crystallogenes]|uniref:DUF4145 domain-containing protein n=1 Tax=Myceligenerans crystallogenes TaxID=316335 RepID=A0ABN2NLE9_9MICO